MAVVSAALIHSVDERNERTTMPGVKGKVGRPAMVEGEKSVHVGARLTAGEHALVVECVEEDAARVKAIGVRATVTVASVLRQLILDGLAARGKGQGVQVVDRVRAAPMESEPDEPGHTGSDERTLREPVHRKRPVVESASPSIEDTPVAVETPGSASMGHPGATAGPPGDSSPPEGENDDLADMAAMLEGTPL